ncbi:single-stranded DNA-binding protein [Georgenia yuyongxinii]
MADRNEITVQGRLGADPVRRVGANRSSWVTFRVGTTPRGRDRTTGEFKDGRTEWFTVKTWGDLAENVADSLHKGNPVVVRGKVYVDSWTGENGERWDHVIHADAVAVEIKGGTVRYTKTIREPAAVPGTAAGVITGPDGSRWEAREDDDAAAEDDVAGEEALADDEIAEAELEGEMSAAGLGRLG